MPRRYEFWESGGGDAVEITGAPPNGIRDLRARGLLGPDARLLYVIEAATHEEAMAIHHLRMGWEPYRPGRGEPCSRCGAVVYGSGDCWRCGAASR